MDPGPLARNQRSLVFLSIELSFQAIGNCTAQYGASRTALTDAQFYPVR